MDGDTKETARYVGLGMVGVVLGLLSHKTDPFFVKLERGGTGYRWILWGRYAIGTVGLFATSLLYFIGRRISFVEALGIFSQVALNYGGGVVIGHLWDELQGK